MNSAQLHLGHSTMPSNNDFIIPFCLPFFTATDNDKAQYLSRGRTHVSPLLGGRETEKTALEGVHGRFTHLSPEYARRPPHNGVEKRWMTLAQGRQVQRFSRPGSAFGRSDEEITVPLTACHPEMPEAGL
jgi:hypothetical protein